MNIHPPSQPTTPVQRPHGAPDSAAQQPDPQPAEVAISRRRLPSIVWLIPVVALLIGGWLAYQTINEKGPTITLRFETADGLEAGKTRIKYKSVNVGLVEQVDLSDDLQEVIVTASLDKGATPHLTEATQFWVVRPQVSLTQVSGLGTLISGAYIAIEPGVGESRREFIGLNTPPVVRRDVLGNKYVLKTQELGSIAPGSPIYYREMPVGEVLGYELSEDDQTIEVHVFVESPHHRLVREGTRFYNVSGIDLSMGADGMQVRTASLASIIAGGIAFETPDQTAPGAPDDTVFQLYPNQQAAAERVSAEQLPYVLYFEDSVRGLSVGAPVEFRGIRVGEVSDVHIEFDSSASTVRIPVTIAIEPERVPDIDGRRHLTAQQAHAAIQALVTKGMRAQLETGSLITGARFIALDLHPDEPPRLADVATTQPQLPTIDSTFNALSHSASRLLAKLGDLPLDQLVQELTRTVHNLNTQVVPLAASVGKTSDSADAALQQMRETLGVIAEGAPLQVETLEMLQEGAAAARSIRVLTEYLERHPEALISGKGS